MDISKFDKDCPGSLITIDKGKDVAFIPDPMPNSWEVPKNLVPTWVKAREVLGELRGTGRTLPDPNLLLRPLRQREAIRSSSLEGTYATPEELLAYEKNPRDPSSKEDPANSWREVSNYERALGVGQGLIDEGYPFSEWLARQLHERLLIGVRGEDKSPGEIRKTQVHIGAGHRFTPPPAEHLSSLLGRLESEMQAEVDIDPLIRALMIHYQFETIHPFRDGNGRVGRLLLALMIFKHCDFNAPWLYLSEFFDRHRDDYIDALFNVSAKGDWARWIELGLLATIETGRNTIKRITKIIALKEEYEERIREHEGRDRLMHLVPHLLTDPIISYSDVMTKLEVTYPTARADVAALISMDIVDSVGWSKRPKLFMAREIFRLAYFDDQSD